MRSSLLAWFDKAKRDLPWRKRNDAYAIWLSEVMLQQTQVQTVIPYWERFLQRYPTVDALARAPLDDVLQLWSGLGYYSRARNLHRCAQQVAALGGFPRTAAELKELPGFGPYTAGAVASIAFGEPAPLVDGNVARVLSRLFVIEGAPGDKPREKALWAKAAELVEGARPGDFNQALMELGALVCRTDNPACLLCPLAEHCGALKAGRVAELPPPRVRAPRKLLNLAVAIWEREGTLLFVRREGKGLFGGLWELPSVEYPLRDVELSARFTESLGVKVTVKAGLGVVRRTLTHRDLELHLFQVRGTRAPAATDAVRWVKSTELSTLGISTAMAQAVKAFDQLHAPRQQSRA